MKSGLTRKDIEIRALADGTRLNLPVYHFSGQQRGAPSAYIQSSVHGAEVQGYWVAMLLIDYFAAHAPLGDVTIVPIANPYALSHKSGAYTLGRFDPVTGENWNRKYIDLSFVVDDFLALHSTPSLEELTPMFKEIMRKYLSSALSAPEGYAQRLALELQRMAVSADKVLDLHCDTSSVEHIYSPNYASASAEAIGIPLIIEMDNVFGGALDEAIFCPWAHLSEQYALTRNVPKLAPPVEAFTVELGDQEHVDHKKATQQAKGLLRYLSASQIIEATVEEAEISVFYKCHQHTFLTIYAPRGGIIIEHAPLGVPLKAHQTLLILSTPDTYHKIKDPKKLLDDTRTEIKLPEAVIPINCQESAIAHEQMPLMKVMSSYRSAPLSTRRA